MIKGSCRSGDSVSVVDLMTAVKSELINFGGHHKSGGLSVSQSQIHTLREKLNNAYLKLKDTATTEQPTLAVDYELSLDQVGSDLVETLKCLAPHGLENKPPIFLFRSVTPLKVDVFGRGGEHTKLTFDTDRGELEAICFFKQPKDLSLIHISEPTRPY